LRTGVAEGAAGGPCEWIFEVLKADQDVQKNPMPKPTKTSVQDLPALSPLELNRIVRPPEAERLSGRHWDTLQRNHPELIIRMGKRCVGMRAGHVLQLMRK
jgi:hypothetical protein